MGSRGHSASVGGADVKAPRGRIVQQDFSVLAPSMAATFCPGVFGVEALPQFIQLWSRYHSLEGGLPKDLIWLVVSPSQSWPS